MSVWDSYSARLNASGYDKRSAAMQRERRFLNVKLPNSLSYHQLVVDGEVRNLAVINSDNLDLKTICSLPGEDIRHGSLVEWMDNRWLVTERDANNELYTKAKMRQCNYLLRWIADDGNIIERWCIIEDGTKYLTGEYGDNQYIITRGDSRISMTIARDEYTIKLNRDNRFLIDDYDSENILAYRLTKPFKLGGSYNGNGVLYFVLQECNTEDGDNLELHIANYYDHFPRETQEPDGQEPENDAKREDVDEFLNGGEKDTPPEQPGKKVWL